MIIKNLLFLFLLVAIISNKALACLSITDDFNNPNPVINANFRFEPDISPFTDCWTGTIKVRSSQNGWRLIATRTGPTASNAEGDPSDNVMASDITLDFSVQNFGMADSNGAILVSPFSSQTNLSSIQYGTFVISGVSKTSNSCSSSNPNYYKVTKRLCLFRDFVFNPGSYEGQVSYILINP